MKYLMEDANKIANNAQNMRRVFLNSDLSVLFNSSGKQLFDRINYLSRSGVLQKAMRGVYLSEGWQLIDVAARINPDSYITGPTVLAEYMMIGTLAQKKVYCVKMGSPRRYEFLDQTIQCYSLQESLFFGFEDRNGYKKALPEKALLDTLYFYLRGERYFFDLFSDVNVSQINQKRFSQFLQQYQNPKFRRFASDYLAKRN